MFRRFLYLRRPLLMGVATATLAGLYLTAGSNAAIAATPDTAVRVASSSLTSLQDSGPRTYFLSPAGHVEELRYSGGWIASDLSAASGAVAAASGSSLTSLTLNGNDPRIYFLNANDHVQELRYSGGWIATDLSSASGAVVAAP